MLLHLPRFVKLLFQAIRENGVKGGYHFKRAALFAAMVPNDMHLHAEFASLPATYVRYAAGLRKQPYSVSAHARDVFVESSQSIKNIQQAGLVLFCTKMAQSYCCGQMPDLGKRSQLIYHGIDDLTEEIVTPPDSLMISALGRLIPKKGYTTLIKACSLLRDERIAFRCTIAGSGPELEALQIMTEKRNLQDSITFPGMLDRAEVHTLLKRSTLLCVPSIIAEDSDRDGIPNVILEAGRLGVPTIGSDLPGIKEVIKHSQNGFIFTSGDARQLADQVKSYNAFTESESRTIQLNIRESIHSQFNLKRVGEEFKAAMASLGITL